MDLGKLGELSQKRVCQECGAEFELILAKKDAPEVPALAQFADHLRMHQPTGDQWTRAYDMIQAGKERQRAAG